MITTSAIITDRQQRNGTRKIREKHVDHLGGEFFRQYVCGAAYDADAALLVHAAQVDAELVQKEIDAGIAVYEQGSDPLHIEVSENNWQKITPEYQTWGELAAAVLISFLEREDRNDLVFIESIVTRISTNDKKSLWGMTNQEVSAIHSDIQLAVDAKTSLDLYSPYFVEGVKV